MDRADIPLEFAKDPEVQQMYANGLPPEWAHHEFHFRLHPKAAGG
jgi:hypothetical protein